MTSYRVFPILLALAVSACGGNRESAPDAGTEALAAPLSVPDPGPVLARVDGVEIRQSWLEAMARGRNLDLADPAQRQRGLDELVEYAVLLAAARARPDLADRDIRADIELNALAGRANAVLARVGAIAEPDEAALRAEYQQQQQVNGDREYAVAHLLFAEEAVALDAAGAALAGKAFAEVQAEFRERARQAVDLGWVKLGQLPPEFAASLRGLAPGQVTPVPVQTGYGWHVIHLRETRPFTPPAFEQVREGIRRMLVANASRAAVLELKERAQIEIVEP